MRIFFYFLPLALAIALAISCKSSTQTESKEVKQEIVYGGYNPYIEDYAGGYRVVSEEYVSEMEGEAYILDESGNAQLLFIVRGVGDEPQVLSEKQGNWEAAEDRITISIQDDDGVITEEYELIDGKFVFGNKSLKRME